MGGHKLRMFEKRTLRGKFAPEGGKLHSEEPHKLYCWPNFKYIKEDEMDKACSTYGRDEKC
jgi:hypothetical protein